MTVIVGLVAPDDRVLIGGDSAGVAGWDVDVLTTPKVFVREGAGGQWAFGYTTSFRMGQIVQYELKLPDTTDHDEHDLEELMVVEFVGALRKSLRKAGWLKKSSDRVRPPFLVVEAKS